MLGIRSKHAILFYAAFSFSIFTSDNIRAENSFPENPIEVSSLKSHRELTYHLSFNGGRRGPGARFVGPAGPGRRPKMMRRGKPRYRFLRDPDPGPKVEPRPEPVFVPRQGPGAGPRPMRGPVPHP